MALLKEDGSLDVERIRKLPLEEKRREMSTFTREQVEEYFSKVPVSNEPITPIKVDYKMEDLLAKGCATSEQIFKMLEDAINGKGRTM